ncbi:hypothetical protein ACWCPY_43180, partial [Streptomyces sp. NPDC002403]
MQFGNERRQRVGVRVRDLGGHGLAHLPTIEGLARTIRQLAAQRERGVGVHLEVLTTHLRGLQELEHLDLQEFEVRGVLEAAGISVQRFTWLDGDERRKRLGVRVEDLGGHGLAHLPTIEDLARTVYELASANDQPGVHLDDLATHLRSLQELEHLDLQKYEIRGALEAAGIDIQRIELWVGDERRDLLGVRVDALGRHGLAHLPTIEDLARTIRELAEADNQPGVHLAALATRLRLKEDEIRRVLEAHGIPVQQLKLPVGDRQRNWVGVRVDALGQHGRSDGDGAGGELGELPPDASDEPGRTGAEETTDQDGPSRTHHPDTPPLAIEDLARTIRELAEADNHLGVHLDALTTHLSLREDVIGGVLEAAGVSVKKLELRFDGKRRFRLGVRVDALGRHGLAHLPTIEDLARAIRELAAADNRLGVHLDALAAHLRRKERVIRGVLEANGISIKNLDLPFGDERRQRVGVRVDALGGYGLAHLPAVEDLARTVRELAAADNQPGVHLADLAARLRLREDEVRGVLEAAGVSVRKLNLRFGGKQSHRLGVRVDALGGRGLVGGGSGGLFRDASGGAGGAGVGESVGPVGSGGARHRVSLRPVVGGVAGSSRDRVAVNGRGGVHPADPDGPASLRRGEDEAVPGVPGVPGVSAVSWAGAVEHGRWGEGVSGAGEYGVGPGARRGDV